MKVELGKRYLTNSGSVTGPLKLNPHGAINYPYLDPHTNRIYSETGDSGTTKMDNIYGEYREETATELPQVVDTVTISRKDYDRFVALERAFKEVYEQTKGLV